MAKGLGFVWTKSPEETIKKNIVAYGQTVLDGVDDAAHQIAREGKEFMQANAPWTDRTGRARRYLRGYVTKRATETTVTFSHGSTIDYGIWLEVKNGGRYAIVGPTFRLFSNEYMRLLKGKVRG